MTSVPKWRRYLRFWRPDPAADVDDGLRTHFELREAELRGAGLCAIVIGVAADARSFRLREDWSYWHYSMLPPNGADASVLLVRVAPGVRGVDELVRAAVRELDPSLPYVDVRVLGDVLDPQMRPWRLGAAVFTAFGAPRRASRRARPRPPRSARGPRDRAAGGVMRRSGESIARTGGPTLERRRGPTYLASMAHSRSSSRSASELAPDPVIEAYKRDVDRTLLRENLRRSVEERVEALAALLRLAREAQRAGRPKDFESIAELEVLRRLNDAEE